MDNHNLVAMPFDGSRIRKTWYNEQWYFAIVDVIEVLTDSKNPSGYIKDMRRRDAELSKGWGQIATPLSILTAGGKQKINCANTEGLLRIIMSVTSPKAEPLKIWLAQVGYERIQETDNPELTAQRAREGYKNLGYDDNWIDTRLQSIAIRGQLTDEWSKRDVKEGQEYAILTAEISKATFGITPSEHKEIKDLKRENLRDHMDPLELIFTMLGEETTRQAAIKRNAKGFVENRDAARQGGSAAGNALKAHEETTGEKVITGENYKNQIAAAKKKVKDLGKE